MRLYQPIWTALKSNKTVTIKAPQNLHKRIVKAVIKEKWKDKAFKNSETWRKAYLSHSINGDELTFILSYPVIDTISSDL